MLHLGSDARRAVSRAPPDSRQPGRRRARISPPHAEAADNKGSKMSIDSYGTATCAAAILGAAVTAAAFARAPDEQPILREIAHSPDPVQLQATVQALVGFGTRHTPSDTASPRQGNGAAARWLQARFAEIGRGCGGWRARVTTYAIDS